MALNYNDRRLARFIRKGHLELYDVPEFIIYAFFHDSIIWAFNNLNFAMRDFTRAFIRAIKKG